MPVPAVLAAVGVGAAVGWFAHSYTSNSDPYCDAETVKIFDDVHIKELEQIMLEAPIS